METAEESRLYVYSKCGCQEWWAKITLASVCFGTDIGEYKYKREKGKTGGLETINWMNEWVSERMGGKQEQWEGEWQVWKRF